MTKIVKTDMTILNGIDLEHKTRLELSKLEDVALVLSMRESSGGYLNAYANGEMLQYDPVENTFVGKHGTFLLHEGWVS